MMISTVPFARHAWSFLSPALVLAFVSFAPFTVPEAAAAAGELDVSFNGTGKVTTSIGTSSYGEGRSVVVQADGKIVLVGNVASVYNSDFGLVRYNADGSLDAGFGNGGKIITDIGKTDYPTSAVVQGDGKIVVAGYSGDGSSDDFVVVRYNTNGTLDTGFGSGGKVTTSIGSSSYDEGRGVVVQSDGKIVVAGFSKSSSNSDFALVRYNANGSLDLGFGSGGKVTTPLNSNSDFGRSVAVQPDGKIVVAGERTSGTYSDFAVVRYNADGSLDMGFGDGGKVTTSIGSREDAGHAVVIQGDGKIVVAGYSYNGSDSDFALVRYNVDGSLDTGFGSGGKVTTRVGYAAESGYGVALQSNGKIAVAGFSDAREASSIYSNWEFALVRYNANGTLDTGFGAGGKVTTAIGSGDDFAYTLAIQGDGKIVLGGYSESGSSNRSFALTRYEAFSASAPAVTTSAATAITSAGATLNGVVNAGDLDTAVTFEYGLTTSYGTSIPAAATPLTGIVAIPVGVTLSGLQPRTTYYYRVVATNALGTTVTEGVSFTTANSVPVASMDMATMSLGRFITIEVLGNDSDPDGDSVSLIASSAAQHGNVIIRGGVLSYVPDPGFSGEDTFTYTISDGFGGTATGTVKVTVPDRAQDPVATLLSAKDQPVPGAGVEGSGTEALPAGSTWATFGAPAINDAGQLAFGATVRAGKATHAGIFTYDAQEESYALIARKGDAVPELQGPVFATLKDPVLDEAGRMAFLATLAGPGTTKASNEGVFTTAYGDLQPLARKGDQAKDAPAGAKWTAFLSLALPDGVAGPLFIAKMAGPRTTGINASNDVGLWGADSSGDVRLLLQEGQTIGGKKLKSFVTLSTVPSVSGQTRSFNQAGEVVVRAQFTDGSHGLVTVQIP